MKGVTGSNGQSFPKRLKPQEKGGQPLGSKLALTKKAAIFQSPQATSCEHARSQANGQQGRSLNESPPSDVNHCCHQGWGLRWQPRNPWVGFSLRRRRGCKVDRLLDRKHLSRAWWRWGRQRRKVLSSGLIPCFTPRSDLSEDFHLIDDPSDNSGDVLLWLATLGAEVLVIFGHHTS